MLAVTAAGSGGGGASGSGAGCGCGPGNAEAGIAVGGLTNSSSAADLAWSRFFPSLFFTVDAVAIEGAATAAIGVIRIVKESKQATNALRLPDERWRDCFTTMLFIERRLSVVSS
jgi:hypothetical protein